MLEVGRTDAPADVAAWLRVKADEPVVVRRLQLVNDEPVVLSASYFLLSVAGGTRLELPEPLPEGPDTAIENLGHRFARVVEVVSARMPTPRKPASFAWDPAARWFACSTSTTAPTIGPFRSPMTCMSAIGTSWCSRTEPEDKRREE